MYVKNCSVYMHSLTVTLLLDI